MLWNAFTVRYLHVVIEAYRNDNRPWTPAARLLGQMLHSPYFHRWLATLTTPSGLALRQIERCSSWEAEKAEPATIIRMLTLVADLAALEKLNATDHLTQTVKNDFRRRIMAWMKRYAENSPLVDLVEENLTIFTVGSTGREASDEHRTEITIYQRKCSLPDCNIHGSAEEKNSLFQCSRCHIFRVGLPLNVARVANVGTVLHWKSPTAGLGPSQTRLLCRGLGLNHLSPCCNYRLLRSPLHSLPHHRQPIC